MDKLIVIGGICFSLLDLIKTAIIIAIIIFAIIIIKKIIKHEKHKINLLEEQNKLLRKTEKKE